MQKFFDGHNDLLLRLWMEKDLDGKLFFNGGNSKREKTINVAKNIGIKKCGHLDLNRAKAGGFHGGFFAVFVPNQNLIDESKNTFFNTNLSFKLDQKFALKTTLEMINILLTMSKSYPDIIRLIKSKKELDQYYFHKDYSINVILHIEGAEAISKNLSELKLLYDLGLRSLGPVWSRNNIFGNGVPFDFPGTPDIGSGLTDIGKKLVKECNKLGILIDLSHMNEAGFWDVAKITSKPLVATHSNVHLLSTSPRNLTSKQLDAIAESDGLVGLNFATGFIRKDGKRNAETSPDDLMRHLDHLLSKLGENGVAIGSDFDGALIPNFIGDCSGLPMLVKAMKRNGYGDSLINKICYENWYKILRKIIK